MYRVFVRIQGMGSYGALYLMARSHGALNIKNNKLIRVDRLVAHFSNTLEGRTGGMFRQCVTVSVRTSVILSHQPRVKVCTDRDGDTSVISQYS